MKKRLKTTRTRGKKQTSVKYAKLPKTLGALSQGYDALIRELGKR